jgi:hypothetical protein
VFSHSCSKEGVFTSYIFENHDACPSETKKVPPCCQKEDSKNDGCCSDYSSIYKIDIDYSKTDDFKTDFSFNAPINTPFVFDNTVNVNYEATQIACLFPPPWKPSGKLLLIKKQVFQI